MSSPASSHAPREQWQSQMGFILAAVGSAIGLGNIWRFPGVAYTNGGGAFLIPYLVALLTAGVVYLLFDWALGHRYRGSAPAIFRRIHPKFEPLGWFQVGLCFAIITYYAVIVAWSVRYVGYSLTRAWGSDPAGFFVKDFLRLLPESQAHVTGDVVPSVMWPLVLVWLFTTAIMALGVAGGLERMNKIFLPLLVVMFVGMVVRAVTLPGAVNGLNSFFTPKWSALADPHVWVQAYAQIFFSLSVMFGIMITYASYLPRRANLAPTSFVVAFSNSSFELLAGIGVFSTLGFMADQQGIKVSELEGITGPILSFVTFPQVISMMPGGQFFGVLFFGSLALAGITSLVSLIQVVTAAVQEKFGMGRTASSVVVGLLSAALSIGLYSTSNGLNTLDVVDNFVNNIGIVLSAVLTVFLLTFVVRRLPELHHHLSEHSASPLGGWWRVFAGYVTPIMLTVMLVLTGVDLVTNGYGKYPEKFTLLFGWGSLALITIASLALSALPWRTSVDHFRPARLDGMEHRPYHHHKHHDDADLALEETR
ncbi:sodium-dependent transporter [Luteococcus sp. H138]|uniref:sodium-dependent transporter n=1 Tax=unclassified Luteococcus TaxID=2639923 RepID=UPI00313B00B5